MNMHMLFVDFIQAFGSVNRKRLYEVMAIPDKLNGLTLMTIMLHKQKL
jgi:hypothetical protein